MNISSIPATIQICYNNWNWLTRLSARWLPDQTII